MSYRLQYRVREVLNGTRCYAVEVRKSRLILGYRWNGMWWHICYYSNPAEAMGKYEAFCCDEIKRRSGLTTILAQST